MYGKTLNSQTFMDRSANHSTKGSRRGFELLGHGDNALDVLKPEELRENLVRRKQQIELLILPMRKSDVRRIELCKEKTSIDDHIHALRPKLKGHKEAAGHFISVAKERLPKALYQAIMDEACKRALQYQNDKGD